MDNSSITTAITVLSAVIGTGGLGTICTLWFTRKKSSAEARSLEIKGELQIVDAATKLVDQFQDQISSLTKRVELLERERIELRRENAELRHRCEVLEKIIKKHGIELEIR